MEERTCDCAVKHKHRQAAEEKDLLNRLNRIEGQIRGIKSNIKSCVVEQIQDGNLEAVDELCMTIQKVMK